MPSDQTRYDDVAKLGARLANLRTPNGYSLADRLLRQHSYPKTGDILFTGTPQGVIFGETAPLEQRRWLRAGDEVVSSLEGLGELKVRLV